MASTLQETVREDGLRVITKRLDSTKKVTVCVSSLVGSAYDAPDKEGLFHFFEHMAFKGTKTRNMHQVKEVLGQLVSSNAYTADLRTTYYGEAVYTKLALLQDIIFDIYANSIFPEEEIAKEKEVVLNEAAMYEDNDSYKAYFMLGALLWEVNPRRRVGVGTAEGLTKINREVLLDANKHWYAPCNTVIIAVGKIDHEKFLFDVCHSFPCVHGKVNLRCWEDEAEKEPLRKLEIIERKNREKGALVWGCKVPQFSDREVIAVKILSEMLGGGFDSMLWSEVREKRGLVYSAGSYFDDSKLASYLAFTAQMLPGRVDEVRDLMRDVVCSYPLEKAHFERVRNCTEDQILISLENGDDWSELLHKKLIDENKTIESVSGHIAKSVKELRSITFEEVVDMREKLIIPERLACAIVKPV